MLVIMARMKVLVMMVVSVVSISTGHPLGKSFIVFKIASKWPNWAVKVSEVTIFDNLNMAHLILHERQNEWKSLKYKYKANSLMMMMVKRINGDKENDGNGDNTIPYTCICISG